jgi:hypothetical protein
MLPCQETLRKIQTRDFFLDERWLQADEMLKHCRRAPKNFSRAVYAAEEAEVPLEFR